MSMKKFNKATLAMAVAGALAASSAQAVNIAEDGLGDFIISPYYTVRDGFQTYINVHNTSEETLVFKIRFREHYNSRDARDFNVILSPFDVWTAAVIMNDAGTAARLVTHDHSCTAPLSIRDNGIDFTNYMWSGENEDGGPTGLERTQEGYFEIINMGQDADITDGDNSTDIADNALHIDVGTERWPVDCAAVEAEFAGGGVGEFALFDEPENALKVNVAIINVNDGLGFAVNPTVLANFYNPAASFKDQASNVDLVRAPSKASPNVTDVNPRIADLHSNVAGVAISSTFSLPADESGADPVTALLMHHNVINQYRVEDGQADTDWVITMPTKNYHVDPEEVGTTVRDPFVELFGGAGNDIAAGSCVQVMYNFWDREEDTVSDPSVIQPSPEVPGAAANELCREVNVLQFGDGVLSGFVPTAIDAPFTSGWLRVDFGPYDGDLTRTDGQDADNEGQYDLSDNAGSIYEGIPSIGFAIQNLDNWNVTDNALVQYGFAWDHSYGRSVWVGGVQMGANPAYVNKDTGEEDLGFILSGSL